MHASLFAPEVRRLDWRNSPIDLLRRWPTASPLVCLVSAGRSRWSRWSIFAAPTQRRRLDSTDPLAVLDSALASTRADAPADTLPFLGGWIGWLSYDLGRVIEPAAVAPARSRRRAADDRRWPIGELFRCPSAFIHDSRSGTWWAVGDESALPFTDPPEGVHDACFTVGEFRSRSGREVFEGSVARTVEYIHAGDVFQANISHRLSAPFAGRPRDFAAALLEASGAWYGGYIESPDDAGSLAHALCCASPELFLDFDPATRRIVTRPIKGTRPATAEDESDLRRSAKDAAELTMIVDLMRNDLGRVCEYGSVRVDKPREIETHGRPEEKPPRRRGDAEKLRKQTLSLCSSVVNSPGIAHGVATVSGVVREGVTIGDVLRASFPPGSVTGAPKVRAMQIIDALEPVRRGPYCGSIGYVSDFGRSAWNVAIRTAAMIFERGSTAEDAAGLADYCVGAGVVAESDPAREWEETLHKAGILRAAAGAATVRGACAFS